MFLESLFERFAAGTPLSVMTRALLENALQPRRCGRTVRASGGQAVHPRTPLLHRRRNHDPGCLPHLQVATRRLHRTPDWFPVTLKCVYEKLQGIELPVMRELLCDNARRCQAVVDRTRWPGACFAAGFPRQDSRRQRPGWHRPPPQRTAADHGGSLAWQVLGGSRPGLGIGHRRHPLRGRSRPGTLSVRRPARDGRTQGPVDRGPQLLHPGFPLWGDPSAAVACWCVNTRDYPGRL